MSEANCTAITGWQVADEAEMSEADCTAITGWQGADEAERSEANCTAVTGWQGADEAEMRRERTRKVSFVFGHPPSKAPHPIAPFKVGKIALAACACKGNALRVCARPWPWQGVP